MKMPFCISIFFVCVQVIYAGPAIQTDNSDRHPSAIVGMTAPALKVEKLLQAPPGTKLDWDSLKGKVVVLEFWATWCTACVHIMPELNELEHRFSGKEVVFINITDEDEKTVQRFLKINAIAGWIGLDTDGSVFSDFEIRGRPITVIIDQTGKFAGWTSPHQLILEPEILEGFIRGEEVPLATKSPRQVALEREDQFSDLPSVDADGNQPALTQIVIRPASGKKSGYVAGSQGWRIDNEKLLKQIGWAWFIPNSRIIVDEHLSLDQKYDIIIHSKKARTSAFKDILRSTIAATFDLQITREQREMNVYVMKLEEGAMHRLKNSIGAVYTDPDTGQHAPTKKILARMKAGEKFFFAMAPLSMVGDDLGGKLGRPVMDETVGTPDYVKICFPYDEQKEPAEVLIRKFEADTGLKLIPARRVVEVLVVEKAADGS